MDEYNSPGAEVIHLANTSVHLATMACRVQRERIAPSVVLRFSFNIYLSLFCLLV
ncbi:hypothetical protein EYZ11_013217 [Aspergillus tanneri]|uniref:Uncharacterized protein n=1 Tax=Aspergillus tanneri TaxID=1220188 RepID=A0A4S3J0B8_9EURO|nr:hypothetical protein EYZ11_013217 [Aspergillus tanneri]